MSIVEKIKSFWLGSDDNYEDGFEDLFKVDSSPQQRTPNGAIPPDSVIPLSASMKSLKNRESYPSTHLKLLEQSQLSATNEVVVIEPAGFNQAPEIIQYLRKGSSVVLNLHKLDGEQSQRLIDFVCGGIYALDGSQQRVGEGVFLLVPSCVNINSRDYREPIQINHSYMIDS